MEVYYNPKTDRVFIVVTLAKGLFAMLSGKDGWIVEGKFKSKLTKVNPNIEQIVYIGDL